jgi:hypothetical protein
MLVFRPRLHVTRHHRTLHPSAVFTAPGSATLFVTLLELPPLFGGQHLVGVAPGVEHGQHHLLMELTVCGRSARVLASPFADRGTLARQPHSTPVRTQPSPHSCQAVPDTSRRRGMVFFGV